MQKNTQMGGEQPQTTQQQEQGQPGTPRRKTVVSDQTDGPDDQPSQQMGGGIFSDWASI